MTKHKPKKEDLISATDVLARGKVTAENLLMGFLSGELIGYDEYGNEIKPEEFLPPPTKGTN